MAKYSVACYAIVEFEVEADSPEEANELAMTDNSEFELVACEGQDPRIKKMYWHWSDAMGSEVYDEEGESVLCDW